MSSSSGGSGGGGASLNKIVIAQVFFLLSTLSEDKWDQTISKIKTLTDTNGPEVYQNFFRRLISGNAMTIFPNVTRPIENPVTLRLLKEELKSLAHQPLAAHSFSDSISTSESDLFKDFDLATFFNHFHLDAWECSVLSISLRSSHKQDLRNKAAEILQNKFQTMLSQIRDPAIHEEIDETQFVSFIQQYLAEPPPPFFKIIHKIEFVAAVEERYAGQEIPLAARILIDGVQQARKAEPLSKLLSLADPSIYSSQESIEKIISFKLDVGLTEKQVAETIIMFTGNTDRGWPGQKLGAALQHLYPSLDWSLILKSLDDPLLSIRDSSGAISLLGILQGAKEANISISPLFQPWTNHNVQITFLQNMLTVQIDRYPLNLSVENKIIQLEDFQNASSQVKATAGMVEPNLFNSLDFLATVYGMARTEQNLPAVRSLVERATKYIPELVMCGSVLLPRPWPKIQEETIAHLFDVFLAGHASHQLVFWRLWQSSKDFLCSAFREFHSRSSLNITRILDIAQEIRALNVLLSLKPWTFSLDLATLAARREYLNIEKWLLSQIDTEKEPFYLTVLKFLDQKQRQEYEIQSQQSRPVAVSLKTSVIGAFFKALDVCTLPAEIKLKHEELLFEVQASCISAYPRLILYYLGKDVAVDSNTFTPAVEQEMKQFYGKMYEQELPINNVIMQLQQLRDSDDPEELDLFACMVHSLFDEYRFFPEYPLNALATTAVLFGSVIMYRLIEGLPLDVALRYVWKALENPIETQMFKFGLQALLHFRSRLSEWPQHCQYLLRNPNLAQFNPDLMRDISTIVESRKSMAANGVEISPDKSFHSLHVDLPPRGISFYEAPGVAIQDKALFILNNLAQNNIDGKVEEFRGLLEEKQMQWFASHLVVKRACVEPNYHDLYVQLLDRLDDTHLNALVLHETYANVVVLLNSENTIQSSMERTLLKNLGAWLGSTTLAQDKPVKHKNIAFKELLLEGYDTKRLIVVLPFTCKVLEQAARSRVFRAPNPWMMGILRLLAELYHSADLKLNLKFEIEVLARNLELDIKNVEASAILNDRPENLFDQDPALIAQDISKMNMLSRSSGRSAAAASLPNLQQHLTLNSSATIFQHPSLKRLPHLAIDRAIRETLGPVVERSVTIAGISCRELISKDFAAEPNEARMKVAAHNMVAALAGSLALVTCRDPLKMTMTSRLREMFLQNGFSDSTMPMDQIAMVVSDNLDLACSIIEKAAQEKGLPEIDDALTNAYNARKRAREVRPNQPFMDPSISRYAINLPELLRLRQGGLNQQQFAVYDDFSRLPRIAPSPADLVRGFPGANDSQQDIPAYRAQFPTSAMDGYPSQQATRGNEQLMGRQIMAKISGLLAELEAFLKEASPKVSITVLPESHDLRHLLQQIAALTEANPTIKDDIISATAQRICALLYQLSDSLLARECLISLLDRFCEISPKTAKDVAYWLLLDDDERKYNVPVTHTLLKARLINPVDLDNQMSKLILERRPLAIEFAARIIFEAVLGNQACAMRTDFVGSLEALEMAARDETMPSLAAELLKSMRQTAVPLDELQDAPESLSETVNLREQMAKVFLEWIRLYQHPSANEKSDLAYIYQLTKQGIFFNPNLSASFFRTALELSIEHYLKEQDMENSSEDAYLAVDALARLVIILYKNQDKNQADGAGSVAFFSKTVSIFTLVFASTHDHTGNSFNQKPFFRLYCSLLSEFYECQETTQASDEILFPITEALLTLQPNFFPAFSFGWLSLISHRLFMPKIMTLTNQKGWPIYAKLLEAFLRFLGPFFTEKSIADTTRLLYKGFMRILLVFLHDFPEFLAEYSSVFCDVIPSSCVQLRNLILSAFPKDMALPDPFLAGLNLEELPEMKITPVIVGDALSTIQQSEAQSLIDSLISTSFAGELKLAKIEELAVLIKQRGELSASDSDLYPANIPLLNALVLYIGTKAIESSPIDERSNLPVFTIDAPMTVIFRNLALLLDPESRYYLFSAMANNLRYPNSHTHYFSSLMLSMLIAFNNEDAALEVKDTVVRVLLERLICNRPHPWGILVTFSNMLKNKKFQFWNLPFLTSSPDIERLFMTLNNHINNGETPR